MQLNRQHRNGVERKTTDFKVTNLNQVKNQRTDKLALTVEYGMCVCVWERDNELLCPPPNDYWNVLQCECWNNYHLRGRVGINSPRVKISDLRKHVKVGCIRIGLDSGGEECCGIWMVKKSAGSQSQGIDVSAYLAAQGCTVHTNKSFIYLRGAGVQLLWTYVTAFTNST